MITGIFIGIIELIFYFMFSYMFRNIYKSLKEIEVVSYYWYIMTVLTFVWETSYIIHFNEISADSSDLIMNNKHVWFSKYPLDSIIPWNLAKIFYAEYGAYADREYMLMGNDWSRIIEGTHAYICGIFSLIALIFKINNFDKEFLIAASISMGSQLMNSILYLSNYGIQTTDMYNVNYNRANFPSGELLSKRPFMYVNIFWTIMPLYAIIQLIKKNLNNYEKKPIFKKIKKIKKMKLKK